MATTFTKEAHLPKRIMDFPTECLHLIGITLLRILVGNIFQKKPTLEEMSNVRLTLVQKLLQTNNSFRIRFQTLFLLVQVANMVDLVLNLKLVAITNSRNLK